MPWTIEYTETALTQLRKLDKRTARRIVASSMNAKQLLTHFDRLADAPDAIPRLRRFVLDLAVRGKLVEQDPEDEPAGELLKRIAAEKKRLVEAGEIKKSKAEWVKVADPSFDLPDSWQWAALGNLFLYDAGIKREPKALNPELWLLELEDVEKDTGRLLARITVAERESKSTKSEFRVDDILYGKLRPYLNKALVADKPGYSTTEIVALRPYIPLCSKYCALALRRPDFVNYVTQLGQGTKMPRLRTEDAVVAPFPLPPLAEQHRIVAKVDELMALCDRLETAQKEREATRNRLTAASLARLNAPDPDPAVFQNHAAFALDSLTSLTIRPDQIKALRQTILNLAVRGKLVEQDPTDGEGGELLTLLKNTRIEWETAGRIRKQKGDRPVGEEERYLDTPANWVWARLSEIGQTQTGTTPSSSNADLFGDYIPFVKPADLDGSEINYNGPGLSEEGIRHSRLTPANSALMVCIGATLGKVNKTTRPICFNQQINSLAPYLKDITAYILLALKSSDFQALAWSKAGTGTLPIISKGKWEVLPVPLPPLAEQRRIVAKIDELMAVCDRLEASLVAGNETRGRLVEAVLYKVLRGDKIKASLSGIGVCCNRGEND